MVVVMMYNDWSSIWSRIQAVGEAASDMGSTL